MKKKQNFVIRRATDGEVTAMNFYYYNKGGASPIALIAVALKSSDAECPSIVIHNKSEHTSTHLVFSEVAPKNDIINCSFVCKGKFIAVLVELEPKTKYNLLVWSLQNAVKSVYNEVLNGHFTKIEPSQVEFPTFSVMSEKEVLIYTVDSNAGVVTPALDKTKTVSAAINLEGDDCLVDQCWLKGDNKLVVASKYKIFVYDNCVEEETIVFEYPAMDMKKLIKDRTASSPSDELYASVDYLIEYITPTSGDDISKKYKPMYLTQAISDEVRERGITMKFDYLKEDEKVSIMKVLYNKLSRRILNERNIRTNCVCRQENGFALGFRGLGLIAVFKKVREGYAIDSANIIKNKDIEAVCSLASAHSDNHIVLSVKIGSKFNNGNAENNGNYQTNDVSTGSLEIVLLDTAIANTIKNAEIEPFEFLFPQGAHSADVTDVALIPTKSFAATVSRDKTLKLWQYGGEQRQLTSFEFTKVEFSKHKVVFDIHPLAVQVAIGFSRGLKIYFLVEGELEIAYECFERSCNAIAYSSRGHMLAVGYGGEIVLLDPYSFDKIYSMKGHSGDIKSLSWVGRDRYLVSLCTKSSFQVRDCWDKDFKIHFDENQLAKGSPPIHAVDYDPEFEHLVCCTDGKVFVHSYGKSDPFAEFETGEGVYFTTVLISKKLQVIFFGTNQGAVRIYLWPLIKMDRAYESTQRFVHLKEITSLKITPNFEYLVTTSLDCTVYFLKIKEIQKGKNVTVTDTLKVLNEQKDAEMISRISNVFSLNEFSFMSNKMQKELIKRMNELESDLQNKITEIDEDNEKLTLKHNKEIQERENQNLEELKRMNIELATKMDEEGSKQKNLELKCKEFKNRLKLMVKEKEEQHREQLLKLYEERDQIENEMKRYTEEKDRDLNESKRRFDSDIEKLKNEFQKNEQQINKQYAQVSFYIKEDEKKFQEALRQTEDEYNTLLKNTEKDLNDKLNTKKKQTDQIKTKYKKLIKDNQKNTERYANLEKLIEETKTQNAQLENDIAAFRQKYKEMEARLNEQEDVINKKESKIKEYRNKNFHLQNFKSVYDHKVTTLKEAHEPLTEYVDNLEVKINDLRNTLKRCTMSCSRRQTPPRHSRTTLKS